MRLDHIAKLPMLDRGVDFVDDRRFADEAVCVFLVGDGHCFVF